MLRAFRWWSLLLALAMCLEARAAERPNLVVLLADDLGYGDLSCFGGTAVATPHLDRLADEGAKLTQCYAASAVCSPTRAALLTGRYPLRFDIRRHFPDDESHLPAGTTTLATLLKQAGYQTAHVGKWHLGGLHLKHIRDRDNSIPGPHQHGFDHYLCQNEESPLRRDLGQARRLYRDGGTCLIRNEQQVGADDPRYTQHFTDINGDETVELIDRFHRQGRPFFINVWWLDPHMPYEPAPEPHWSNTAAAGISDDQHRFRSMVAHMDAKIGQIVSKLDALGIREKTLILFSSDNGGAYEADIGDLKGGKTDLHEGGIRVPMIVNWPGHVPARKVSGATAHTTDILPTLCEAAGVTLPRDMPLDGLSLIPHLVGGKPITEDQRGTLLWQIDLYPRLQRHYDKPEPHATEAARRGRWKLLARDGEPQELFDVEADPQERRNLLAEHPRVVEELAGDVRAFLAEPRTSWKAK